MHGLHHFFIQYKTRLLGGIGRYNKNGLALGLCLLLLTCTESFVIEAVDFERIMVVEATITNEMKRQVVKLTRTIGLEDFGQEVEENATVKVRDSNGTTFNFSAETGTNRYLSDEEFQAKPGVEYILMIITEDGHRYTSAPVTLPPAIALGRVYAALITQPGKEGIQVLVDSDNAGDARYFRYEYEETYKVVLPHPSPFRWRIYNYSDFTRTYQIELMPRRLDLACYVSTSSSGILQTSTIGLGENKILRFPVRFIDKADPITRDRHSILIKQYVQSLEAFTFYQTLADLGNTESLLSQGQPGYVTGNVFSETALDEKILGFFEASSVSSQRIFFNYEDFGLTLPPYFVECDHLISHEIGPTILKRKLEFENYQVFFYEEAPVNGSAPKMIYHISQSECTDCPLFSTPIKPDFWED